MKVFAYSNRNSTKETVSKEPIYDSVFLILISIFNFIKECAIVSAQNIKQPSSHNTPSSNQSNLPNTYKRNCIPNEGPTSQSIHVSNPHYKLYPSIIPPITANAFGSPVVFCSSVGGGLFKKSSVGSLLSGHSCPKLG